MSPRLRRRRVYVPPQGGTAASNLPSLAPSSAGAPRRRALGRAVRRVASGATRKAPRWAARRVLRWALRIALQGNLGWMLLAALLASASMPAARAAAPPNVILIMTDDQGYGDLGLHGNPIIRTPHLDRFARQSVRIEPFYVSPVCSPTRASLLTGRYNYRTGVVDTYLGRSLMHPDEVTLAEMLRAAGYRTGIFGKWHLGDNYPLRASDQGFDESLVHRGGGIGQPADPPDNSYFDPVLHENNVPRGFRGYCSDVFTDGLLSFVARHRERPFFAYLAFNCPHTPLDVADELVDRYRRLDLSHASFPLLGFPLRGPARHEETARIYAMVTNIDDNVGRLLAELDRLNLAERTIVVFLTDNGPAHVRYNAGLRDRKGSVYEGGIRVPCFVRLPGTLPADTVIDGPSAHIDLVPTLLEACGVEPPEGVPLDGVSLWPQLTGRAERVPDRTLFFQWHRGDAPEPLRAAAVRGTRFKLVQPLGVQPGSAPEAPPLELYDLAADPYEQHDLAAEQPDVVSDLVRRYDEWFRDVSATRGYGPPRIHLGSEHENPVTLSRQDWRGPAAGWAPHDRGYWEVHVARDGRYDVTLRFVAPAPRAGTARLELGSCHGEIDVPAGARHATFSDLALSPGDVRLSCEVWTNQAAAEAPDTPPSEGTAPTPDKEPHGVMYVDVERRR